MKFVARSIIFLYLANLIRGQSEVDSNTKIMGDSGWWSRRITKINNRRRGDERIGLASKDNQRQDRRWDEETVIRDLRRRPRPFALVLHSNAETRFHDSFESQREHFHKDEESQTVNADFNVLPDPSPILLPPYNTLSPVYRGSNIFDDNTTEPYSRDESLSLKGGKSTSTLGRIQIYEITALNSTSEKSLMDKTSYTDDSSDIVDVEKNHWTNFIPAIHVNGTKITSDEKSEEKGQNLRDSFYIDEEPPGDEKIVNFERSNNRSNLVKNPWRGNRKYQDDFIKNQSFMRKRIFSSRYDWRKGRYNVNHSGFIHKSDASGEVGSVPGIPGRDYPIHQEHTHHRLRNVVDRFPCPRTPKTQVYLADRASRCQIFYVCYGSKTGVPMVCPNGTLFSEPLQVCDWWYNVAC